MLRNGLNQTVSLTMFIFCYDASSAGDRTFSFYTGHMMPTQGDLYIAPFTDEMLYMDQMNKARFWQQKTFYSLDLSSLAEAAQLEYFSQPIRVC